MKAVDLVPPALAKLMEETRKTAKPCGRPFIPEFKRRGKGAERLQGSILHYLFSTGYFACVVDDFDVFTTAVSDILKEGKLK